MRTAHPGHVLVYCKILLLIFKPIHYCIEIEASGARGKKKEEKHQEKPFYDSLGKMQVTVRNSRGFYIDFAQ